ncbi:hypothetical protein B0A52_08452 [Exophiala mesophila]|uniref:Uncharacterized protein n=1 Tax=Exophiala mesophila TaxID=212818 RepID=A0A438MWD2_EXOME|nr:hypothetical protein B0A52_08452 [Exophiala mesophila]
MFLSNIFYDKNNPPKPVTQSFSGKTVLITGATTGIGLETAKKLAALDADRVIITARTEEKGRAAKKQIEDFVAAQPTRQTGIKSEIIVLTLEMSSFKQIRDFVTQLRLHTSSLDAAILNAGLMQADYVQTEDGWEEALHVNGLGSFLLGVLILPILIAKADVKDSSYKPHLTFVSSGRAFAVNAEKEKAWVKSEQPLEYVSSQENFVPGLAAMASQYAKSKFVLEVNVRRLAVSDFNKDAHGKPKVIISTTCPGTTDSDISRAIPSRIVRGLALFAFYFIARKPEQSANGHISSLLTGDDMNGAMWKNDIKYPPGEAFYTDDAVRLAENLWSETRQMTLKLEPSTSPLLVGA